MHNNNLYSFNNKYENIPDEKLIEQIRLGDLGAQNYLIEILLT